MYSVQNTTDIYIYPTTSQTKFYLLESKGLQKPWFDKIWKTNSCDGGRTFCVYLLHHLNLLLNCLILKISIYIVIKKLYSFKKLIASVNTQLAGKYKKLPRMGEIKSPSLLYKNHVSLYMVYLTLVLEIKSTQGRQTHPILLWASCNLQVGPLYHILSLRAMTLFEASMVYWHLVPSGAMYS